jgi:hypothetical protein
MAGLGSGEAAVDELMALAYAVRTLPASHSPTTPPCVARARSGSQTCVIRNFT